MYDVIIIGGGAAGLTAGIYTSRGKLKTLLLEKNIPGGLTATTDLIENYPGFPDGINGMELMDRIKRQAERFGTQIVLSEAKGIKPLTGEIEVQTDKESYKAYSVIIATGSIPKRLNIPGEEEFRGRGVSYCATCDGALYRDKEVAVIGCGNSGLQEGEFLLKFVKNITFVEFLPRMNAEKILQERLTRQKNTEFLLNHRLISINGKEKIDSITVEDRQSGEEKTIKVSGVFIYAGFLPNTDFLKGVVRLDDSGFIITDETMQTSTPGIFAVGDVRSGATRQIDNACADGTRAAIACQDYINKIK
ncbi:MAG TPA: thioredoxin-disulfide reductase [Candidatus Omnitrophica bacterium]|nr:thioredoxin-disulfide reductase [Candidatus Omnitrophota bacterium]